jgi:hypothetical protein
MRKYHKVDKNKKGCQECCNGRRSFEGTREIVCLECCEDEGCIWLWEVDMITTKIAYLKQEQASDMVYPST